MHERKRALWKDSLLFFHKALAYGMLAETCLLYTSDAADE